jgi:hypothetical protein
VSRSWITGRDRNELRNYRAEAEARAKRAERGSRKPAPPARHEPRNDLTNPHSMPRGTLLAGALLWLAILLAFVWLLR